MTPRKGDDALPTSRRANETEQVGKRRPTFPVVSPVRNSVLPNSCLNTSRDSISADLWATMRCTTKAHGEARDEWRGKREN